MAFDQDGSPTDLSEQTCVITGASRGIGREIAYELAICGADIVINYKDNKEKAERVVKTIRSEGLKADLIHADVSDWNQVKRMNDKVHEKFGSIDILVNNAGITFDNKFGNMSYDEWKRVMDVNMGGVFNCCRTFYEDIKTSDRGRIINIASIVGEQGNYGQANYAASKGAMIPFTRTLAMELANYESTANCVSPGFTNTDMVKSIPTDVREDLLNKIPLNRFAEPEEIANVVRFLTRESSSYITGQVISVNGGQK